MKESLVQIAKVIAGAKQIFEKEHMNDVVARVKMRDESYPIPKGIVAR